MRLAYAADRVQLEPGADPDDDSSYESRSSYDEAHVDEKWLFLTEKDMKTHLADGEGPPERATKDKGSVAKVMSLVAVARPGFDSDGRCTFDGKIGLWPFVGLTPAQRTSWGRPAGAVEAKDIKVTKAVHRGLLAEEAPPAIRQGRPGRTATARARHDNA